MRLRDRRAGELFLPVVVVTLRAGEIELAPAAMEGRAAGFEERASALVDRDLDRHAARLLRHVGGECEQFLALGCQRARLLLIAPADVDPLVEVDGPPASCVEGRVPRRDALHAFARVAMAVGASLARGASLALPQRLAIEHPEHARIGGVLILHRSRFRTHELVTGLALAERDFSSEGERGKRDQQYRRTGDGTSSR